MGAVAGVAVDGVAVGVMIAVVKLERDLLVVIQRGGAGVRRILLAVHVVFVQRLLNVLAGQAGILRRVLEQLVAHINAGVEDGDDGALAVIAGGVGITAADHAVAGGHGGFKLKGRRDEGSLNTLDLADLLQLGVGHVRREAVGQGHVAILHIDRLAVEDLTGNAGLDGGLCLTHAALRIAGGAAVLGDLGFVEQDDHTDDLFGIDLIFFLFDRLCRGLVHAEQGVDDLLAGGFRLLRRFFRRERGGGQDGEDHGHEQQPYT